MASNFARNRLVRLAKKLGSVTAAAAALLASDSAQSANAGVQQLIDRANQQISRVVSGEVQRVQPGQLILEPSTGSLDPTAQHASHASHSSHHSHHSHHSHYSGGA